MSRSKNATALSILALVFSQLFVGDRYGFAAGQSQSALNLSGTWELINENGRKKTAWNKRFPIMTLIIVEEPSEIRITRKRIKLGKEEVVNYLYYTDGRGETNIGRVWEWPRASKMESVTTRNKDKIITDYKKVWLMGAAVLMVNSGAREQWRLGFDGKTLSLTIRSWSGSSPAIGGPSGPLAGPGGTTMESSFSRSKLVFRRIS